MLAEKVPSDLKLITAFPFPGHTFDQEPTSCSVGVFANASVAAKNDNSIIIILDFMILYCRTLFSHTKLWFVWFADSFMWVLG